MTSVPVPMCYSCVHYRIGEGMTCDAYPDGIPVEIAESQVDHRQPYTGDNGVQFEQNPDVPEPDWEFYAFGP